MEDNTQVQILLQEKDTLYSALLSEYEKLKAEIAFNNRKYESLEQKELQIDEEKERINAEIEELEKDFEDSLRTQKNLDEQEQAEEIEEKLKHLVELVNLKQGQVVELEGEIMRIKQQLQEQETENESIIEEKKQYLSLEEWTSLRDQLQKQLCEQSETQNTVVQEIVNLINKIKDLDNSRSVIQYNEREFQTQAQSEAQSRDIKIRKKDVEKHLDDLEQQILNELNQDLSKSLQLIEFCKVVCKESGGEELQKRSGLVKFETRVMRFKEYLEGLLSKVKSIRDALPRLREEVYESQLKAINDINKQITGLN